MATYNNWMTHNLHDRLSNPNLALEVALNPYKFSPMSFNQAADYTAMLLGKNYPNIFLSFSGGMDSDFVFHVFERNQIKFTPIIVETTGNKVEMDYALYTCRKFNRTPVVVNLTDKDYLTFYKTSIIDKLNGNGLCAVPGVFACDYAKHHNGICVIGEHMIDNNEHSLFPGCNEWDFYNEALIGEEFNIPFFNYTVELANAMISEINNDPIDEWKHKLFDLDYRPIIDYQFSDVFLMYKAGFNAKIKNPPIRHYSPGTKEQLLQIFKDKYIK